MLLSIMNVIGEARTWTNEEGNLMAQLPYWVISGTIHSLTRRFMSKGCLCTHHIRRCGGHSHPTSGPSHKTGSLGWRKIWDLAWDCSFPVLVLCAWHLEYVSTRICWVESAASSRFKSLCKFIRHIHLHVYV